MATMWNPYFYSLGGLIFLASWSVYLVTCWLHDILILLLYYCPTGILTYWLNNLVIYWLWLDLLTEWMTCLDCMVLCGLHDCASLFLVLFNVNFMMNPKSALYCASCKGTSFWRHELWDRMSNSQYVWKGG